MAQVDMGSGTFSQARNRGQKEIHGYRRILAWAAAMARRRRGRSQQRTLAVAKARSGVIELP